MRRGNVVAFSVMKDGEEKLVVAAEANSSDAPELRKAIATKISETHGLTAGYVAIVTRRQPAQDVERQGAAAQDEATLRGRSAGGAPELRGRMRSNDGE